VVTAAARPPHAEFRADANLRSAGAIEDFLLQHPGAADLIAESSVEIRRIFGPQAGLVLDVPPDYDDEGVTHMYVRILTSLDIEDALDCLDRFNDEWWWDRMGSAPNALHFTTEHVE